MLHSKHIDKICIIALVLAMGLTALLFCGESLGLQKASASPAYATRLFDGSRVHAIDLQVEDWEAFLQEKAPEEEYIPCTVVVDGEEFRQVGLRAKGNNSRRLTHEYGLSRYSLKLEFDHYTGGSTYYGLDKLSLDSSFQDNSYLKTWLVYDMMDCMGVPTPLCSYVWVTVNGAPWGLFLAVEEPEESFAKRNFGSNYGELYKPDYRSLNDENADVALRYVDDDPQSYDNIFRNAKWGTSQADQERLIGALKTLSTGENLESAVNVDEVLRYFTVQVFVMNWDSYLGPTGHNYFLYEEDGVLQILPWDYNLAFGTYALGMTDPIRDPNVLINYPIDTPAEGEVMLNRPLYHTLMQQNAYFRQYHEYFDALLSGYFESGEFQVRLRQTAQMIAPYVKQDPTAFCTYASHQLGVETLEEICQLRAQSARAQLNGEVPSTIRGQSENPDLYIDASSVDIADLGDFDDLETAKARQDASVEAVSAG